MRNYDCPLLFFLTKKVTKKSSFADCSAGETAHAREHSDELQVVFVFARAVEHFASCYAKEREARLSSLLSLLLLEILDRLERGAGNFP
jgi:hypothetical protein